MVPEDFIHSAVNVRAKQMLNKPSAVSCQSTAEEVSFKMVKVKKLDYQNLPQLVKA